MSNRVMWSGRFKEIANDQTLAFSSSLSVDRRMAWYDIVGSIAHARMLAKQGILPKSDVQLMVGGLHDLMEELETGDFRFSDKLEDVHTNVEFRLTERIGEAGARLHTARSRNDQVATDFRMFLRDYTLETCSLIANLQKVLIAKAEEHLDTIMPGFTHMQHAQPVTLAHHLLAHLARLQRDLERCLDSYQRLNVCPLGSAALAGTTFPIDREYVARSLGFKSPCENSMDGVSDRDFAAEYGFVAALCMMHLSSICEEIVIWSSPEFGFVEVSDAFATGSSIMPQKKNPDVAELVRGRSSVALGELTALLTMLKALPLTYNRDLQEDKARVFALADTLTSCLTITASMISTSKYDKDRMLSACLKGYLNATELADYLVVKGIPFRHAHEITGKVVRYAIEKDANLQNLTIKELQGFSSVIKKDVFKVLSVKSCVDRRTSYGGTAPSAVREQLGKARSVSLSAEKRAEAESRKLKSAYSKLLAPA
jgi:argininosuccinate lyase